MRCGRLRGQGSQRVIWILAVIPSSAASSGEANRDVAGGSVHPMAGQIWGSVWIRTSLAGGGDGGGHAASLFLSAPPNTDSMASLYWRVAGERWRRNVFGIWIVHY